MAESEKMTQRVPPQDIDAEMAVLGAVFIEGDAISRAMEILDETCFYRTAHQRIFRAAAKLFDNRQPVDVITMADILQKSGELESVGGNLYLIELAEKVPTAANVEYHARIVLEKALARKLINVTTGISSKCYDTYDDVYALVDLAEKEIFSLSEKRLRKGFVSITPILTETFERIEGYHHKSDSVTGVPTGFKSLDELTSGFQKSELIIIAGRPSMGKTAFALNIAKYASIHKNIPIGIVSLEMASYQLAMRMLCSEAKVDSHLVRTGKLPKTLWTNLSMTVGNLAEAPIYVDDSPAQSILEIKAKARRIKYEKKIEMLIIDYLQLIRGMQGVESRQQEISMISQSLKALSKELDIPIVALSQLSRAVESRGGDRRPQLSDLRESGAIEQDADVVLFIYRPAVYGRVEPEMENIAEVIIGKQRNGPTGTIELIFKKEYVSFEDKSPRQEQDLSGYQEEEKERPF